LLLLKAGVGSSFDVVKVIPMKSGNSALNLETQNKKPVFIAFSSMKWTINTGLLFYYNLLLF
jgi:hypothetical protein